MSRVPIRVRLTAAFALAMVVVLAGAGAFVYLRLGGDLDEAVDERLEAALAGGSLPGEAEESLLQVYDRRGGLVRARGGAREAVLTPSEVGRAAEASLRLERRIAGVEGTVRVLARAEGGLVAAAGQSLDDRDEALDGVVTSFAVGGPVAVVLASLAGWLLAGAGLAPVESMRRRAESVSLERGEERLPLPAAHDEVRRLGETLNEMLDRLRASFERERRFVADASHELRTPLAVLKTELEAALRRAGDDPELRESLAAALQEADGLAQLAEDMLLVARAAESGLPVRPEPVDVRELLEQAAERFGDRARAEGRALTVHAPAGLLADLDPLRARQAIGNLVDNALRHGAGPVELSARACGEAVELEVADAGPGLPGGLVPFERFARGDAARGRPGAGLGLSIVRAIAEAHGGSAELVAGQGARVRLTLPRRSQVALRAPS